MTSRAQGRLTLEELIARLDAAFAATTQSEIAQTSRDLPQLPLPLGRPATAQFAP